LSKGGPALELGSITEEFTPENFDLISNGPAALRTNLGPSVSLALEVTPESLAARLAAAESMTSDAATAERVVADGIAEDATLATEEQVSEYYVTSIQMPSFASTGFGPSIYAGVDDALVAELAAPENVAFAASLADPAPLGDALSAGDVGAGSDAVSGTIDAWIGDLVDIGVSSCEALCI
jgi:hypothetical protein